MSTLFETETTKSRSQAPEPASASERLYHIEDVAEMTGLTRRTLRYYEEIGLLNPPARTEGNYRLYTQADIERLRRIRRLKDVLGLSLKEIHQLLSVESELETLLSTYPEQQSDEQRREVLARAETLTERQIALVAGKMEALSQLNDTLHARLERYRHHREELEERAG